VMNESSDEGGGAGLAWATQRRMDGTNVEQPLSRANDDFIL
jgi:hypothetical protein